MILLSGFKYSAFVSRKEQNTLQLSKMVQRIILAFFLDILSYRQKNLLLHIVDQSLGGGEKSQKTTHGYLQSLSEKHKQC